MTTGPDKAGFMRAFEGATAPINGSEKREYNHVVIDLMADTGIPDYKMGESEVYLSDMNAKVLRQNFGTQAMEMIKSLADEHGVSIVLHAQSYDDRAGTPGTYDLVEFYKKHGFSKCGSNNEMMREPQAQPVARPPVLTA